MNASVIEQRVRRYVYAASAAELEAWEHVRQKNFRPEAEDAFQDAYQHICSAIRTLEEEARLLWNRSAQAASDYYRVRDTGK